MKYKGNEQETALDENTFESFIQAYGMLPANKQKDFKKKLKEIAEWSYVTFYNKMNGKTTISNLEKIAINDLFRKNGIDVNTNKYVN